MYHIKEGPSYYNIEMTSGHLTILKKSDIEKDMSDVKSAKNVTVRLNRNANLFIMFRLLKNGIIQAIVIFK